MTKYDFKIRRGVFRSGKIRSHGDFKQFESGFSRRKRKTAKWRNFMIMLALVFLITLILFSVHVFSAATVPFQHELEMKNVNQIL